MLRVEEIKRQLSMRLRHLGLSTTSSCEGDLDPVLRAATAGMFFNAACYESTEYDPRIANDAGTHVYRLIRLAKSGKSAVWMSVGGGGCVQLLNSKGAWGWAVLCRH
jgi:hypothetical protein